MGNETVLELLDAILKSDYTTMLKHFPEGIEHRASWYRMPDDFECQGSYEEDSRYTRPAQDKLRDLVLQKAIELLNQNKS